MEKTNISQNNKDNKDKLYSRHVVTKEEHNLSHQEKKTQQETKINSQNKMLEDSLNLVLETTDIGKNTLKELKQNTESINRSKSLAKDVNANSENAQSSLKSIERRRRFWGLFG